MQVKVNWDIMFLFLRNWTYFPLFSCRFWFNQFSEQKVVQNLLSFAPNVNILLYLDKKFLSKNKEEIRISVYGRGEEIRAFKLGKQGGSNHERITKR